MVDSNTVPSSSSVYCTISCKQSNLTQKIAAQPQCIVRDYCVRSGSLNWVASDCKLRSTVGCEWPQQFLKWQSVNPYGDSRFDGGAALKVSVSRLSHNSTSHHYETLVKRAYFHHAMAEYVIIQTEIKLKYNLLQLEKSLKKISTLSHKQI